MKYFLISVALLCFNFSVVAGAGLHTLVEVQAELKKSRFLAATYLSMSLRELSGVQI